jgi:hypothetical protein
MIDAEAVRLGALAEIRAGYPFRGPVEQVSEGPVGVVQMRDLTLDGSVRWADVVRTELAGRRVPDWLVPGDLLLVARGNRYYAASLAEVPGRAVCGPHLFHLRLKSGAPVLPEFLAWQINQSPLQRVLRKAAEGSSQLSIRRPELEALQISVPSMSNQKKVAQLAGQALRERDLLTSLIRNREQQLETLATELAHSAAPSKA